MYMLSPLAENSVNQRDKPAPSRKHDHQMKKSVTRKVCSACINLPAPSQQNYGGGNTHSASELTALLKEILYSW